MLNIFRGRTALPNYRLVAPPNGELQTLVVKEEVRTGLAHFMGICAEILGTDNEDTALRFRGGTAKH